jgi:hypothetical protein
MRWTIRVFISSVIVVLFAYGQAPNAGPAQRSLEVPLQQRVATLEKEVQRLKAELVAIRAQIQRSGSTQPPVASGSGFDPLTGTFALDRSTQTPVAPGSGSSPGGTRPSETEIRTCVAAAPTHTGGLYGQIGGLMGGVMEFGTTITSQGGFGEPPKGTNIFPVRFHAADKFDWDFLAFKDSFGKLTCVRK